MKTKIKKPKSPSQCLEIGTIGSFARKSELEDIADNLLVILKRTGDKFRNISKEEYMSERAKDNEGKKISEMEEFYLDKFLERFPTFDTNFHPDWN